MNIQFRNQQVQKKICRKAFIAIFGISNDRLRRLTTLRRERRVPIDKRGKNQSGNAKSGLVIDSIIQHIASFPVKTAHYTSREYRYLNEKLNILIMYKLFKEVHPEQNVKYSYYKKIFKEQFSLSFGRPQVDTCSTCEELDTKIKSKFLNETAKRVALAEKTVHKKRASKFYKKLKTISELCRADDKVGGICIDYMQNLQLSVIPVQETFYLSQLTVNVLCIHNLKDDKVTFYVYHEGTGTKGPNEVVSFLLHHLDKNPEFKNIEQFHFFSDACAAQNKNHTIVRLFSALVSTNRFKKIEQYYPKRGHSFLPCDRDFSILKRKIKKSDRIYTLKEYVELIITSNKSLNRFTVVLPNSDDILNFKGWWPTYFKKTMLSNESLGRNIPRDQKIAFKISNFRHFIHSSEHDGIVVTKQYIDGLQTHSFRLRNSNKELISFPTRKAYPEGHIPINIKKMQDLRKLEKYLPDNEEVKDFYSEIFNLPTCEGDSNETIQPDD